MLELYDIEKVQGEEKELLGTDFRKSLLDVHQRLNILAQSKGVKVPKRPVF